ncbi:MAG: hypothetical protein QOF19_1130 [Alphaproteobacteria bacterium]|nr:hypothetical protein [Alphaproteobacteria bacterium]
MIGFAIRSVLAQSDQNFELLVVGDGCTDDTAAAVQSFGDSRIRWFDLPKADGIGYRNRNIVLREAKGDLVAHIAHDDLISNDHLEKLAGCFNDDAVEWAYSRPLWVSPDGVILPVCVNLANDDELYHLKTADLFIPISCVIYRRRCHDRYGLWPENLTYSGDQEFWSRILKAGPDRNHTFIPTPTAFHFKANWRSTESLERWPTTGNFMRIAHTSAWWPACLKIQMEPDKPEQATVFAAMDAGGEKWIADVRWAIDRVIDRVTMDYVREGLPKLASMTIQIEQLTDSAQHQAKGNAWLEEQRLAWEQRVKELEKGSAWLEQQRLAWEKRATDAEKENMRLVALFDSIKIQTRQKSS